MKANIVSLSDSKIVRREIDASAIAYKTAPYAYWKLVVANENTQVEKGEVKLVKIKNIEIPGNVIVSPLFLMRNALGKVLDIYEKHPPRVRIEMPKVLDRVAFLAVRDGEIKEGDLLGVVMVYGVGIGGIEEMAKLKPPDVQIELKEMDVNLVLDDGRRRARVKEYRYRRRHIAEWLPVVAEEDLSLKSGKVAEIGVRSLKLPFQTVPVPLFIMRHPAGTLIDLAGKKLRRVEEGIVIYRALFMPVEDGEIKRGDLIGVVNNYYISIGKMPAGRPVLGSQRVNIVVRKNGEISRQSFELQPFGFKRSEIGMLQPVIASENVSFDKGVLSVEIEEIDLPNGTIVQPLYERNNPFGVMVDVVEDRMRMVEEDRKIVRAVFYALREGEIREGDLIGVLNVYNIAILSPAQMISFGVF